MTQDDRDMSDHAFDEELSQESPAQEHLQIEDLGEVTLQVSADLGHCAVTVRDVLELQKGSILTLNKIAGDLADIYINNVPFGKGEVVVLVDSLHVRIAEIVGLAERDGGYA